jgi:hypothetical protein
MTHFTEDAHSLTIERLQVGEGAQVQAAYNWDDVCLIKLPSLQSEADYDCPLTYVDRFVGEIAANLGPSSTLVILGEVIDLIEVQAHMPETVRYQHWIAIKRATSVLSDRTRLPHEHFGALVYTRYNQSLRHARTRIEYTYCPACDKTTKDYGGKKHTYHGRGTLISDVWRDIECDLTGGCEVVIERFADFFGVEPYRRLLVLDCAALGWQRTRVEVTPPQQFAHPLPTQFTNRILHGDCLDQLRQLPDNSIDFAFTDPPYNLKKKYLGYSDDLQIQDYFTWCDEWIAELARVLKPGCTLAILNIPLWAVRHFLFMRTVLRYQNWIVWDALAYPVRLIMPAHYTVLCFTKGEARPLPGLSEASSTKAPNGLAAFDVMRPLADEYCLRQACVETRRKRGVDDRALLTDVWGDIHRLKHNSRRVDHPCQLPPQLMYRLIGLFTRPGEVVLDCFNGAGTTTLAAHQMGRSYVGIEASEKYCRMAEERHAEISDGLDPFRKQDRVLTSKNSPVPRVQKQVYKVPKKVLQLEVRRVAQELGRIPSRAELMQYGKYPIEYYDHYFVSWGEVRAAARNSGMSERREAMDEGNASVEQLALW